MGTVIVAGDLNAEYDTRYDTDRSCREVTPGSMKKDAWVHHRLRTIGNTHLHNPIRMRYPGQRIVTHLEKNKTSRWLDYILMSGEAATNIATRSGIYCGIMDVESDHRPVMADIAIDCAGMAERVVPLWEPHKIRRLRRKPKVTESEREALTALVVEALKTNEEARITTKAQFEAIRDAIKKAAVGTTQVMWQSKVRLIPPRMLTIQNNRLCGY